MAPEMLKKSRYNHKADIWSLGITAIELADGLPPFADKSPLAAIMLIPRSDPPTLQEPPKWSPELNDFIAKCCTKEFRYRPSAIDLLKHPFILKYGSRGADALKPYVGELILRRLQEVRSELMVCHQNLIF
jgi:serine/threonine kinase 3